MIVFQTLLFLISFTLLGIHAVDLYTFQLPPPIPSPCLGCTALAMEQVVLIALVTVLAFLGGTYFWIRHKRTPAAQFGKKAVMYGATFILIICSSQIAYAYLHTPTTDYYIPKRLHCLLDLLENWF